MVRESGEGIGEGFTDTWETECGDELLDTGREVLEELAFLDGCCEGGCGEAGIDDGCKTHGD